MCSICNRYYHSSCILCEGEVYDVRNKEKWKCFLCEPLYFKQIKESLNSYLYNKNNKRIDDNYSYSSSSSSDSDDVFIKKEYCQNEDNSPAVTTFRVWNGIKYCKGKIPIDLLPDEMLIYFEDEYNIRINNLIERYKYYINRIEYQQFYNMSQTGLNLIENIRKEKDYYHYNYRKKKLFFNTPFPIPQGLVELKPPVYIIYILLM